MNKQDNININKNRTTNSKISQSYMLAMFTLAILGIIASMSLHGVDAQMMTQHDQTGNMTFEIQEYPHKMMNNETNDLDQMILEAVGSKASLSLSQAIISAEQSTGDNSFAVAAFSSYQNGYLGYTVILGTPEKGIYYVIVDTDNGSILSTEKISKEELEKRHNLHMDMSINGSMFSH